MSRLIDCYLIRKNRPYWIGGRVAAALGYSYERERQGMRVSGAGMDMCFAVVYDLGAMLWPKGTKKPHGTRNGKPDSDGGYALNKASL